MECSSELALPAPRSPKPACPLKRYRFGPRRDEDALLASPVDALTAHLPNASLLLCSFVRNEAVLSSQIEATVTSPASAGRCLIRAV